MFCNFSLKLNIANHRHIFLRFGRGNWGTLNISERQYSLWHVTFKRWFGRLHLEVAKNWTIHFFLKLLVLLVFSVTPFKIDQNKKYKPFNRLIPESGNRKKVDMQRPSPRFRSQQFSYVRYVEKRFPKIYRDLYGDAMLVPT